MSKLLIFTALVVLSIGFKLESAVLEQKHPILDAKLPAFIGNGYHALKGNPYTHRVDEGFRSPIF